MTILSPEPPASSAILIAAPDLFLKRFQTSQLIKFHNLYPRQARKHCCGNKIVSQEKYFQQIQNYFGSRTIFGHFCRVKESFPAPPPSLFYLLFFLKLYERDETRDTCMYAFPQSIYTSCWRLEQKLQHVQAFDKGISYSGISQLINI